MDLGNVIQNIVSATREQTEECPDDYIGEDGLIYCGKCHTPKQYILKWNGEEEIIPCMCQCQYDKAEAKDREAKERMRREEIMSMRRDGIPDETLAQCRFINDDNQHPEASAVAKRYVQNFDRASQEGKGLMFFGNVGTGKTFLAACIANELLDQGHPVLVTSISRLANRIQSMYEGKQDYIDSLNRYELLVLDDLSAERDTEYMNEIVYSIIDSRYRAKKPLIITTNLSGKDSDNASPSRQRIYSRLREMTFPVKVVGDDRRRWGKSDELRKILGI